MTTCRLLPAVLLVFCAAAPVRALDSLEEVACICADDALNQGDFVSCVSHLSRRLVAKGVIGQAERSEAVSGASRVDLAALASDCASGGGEGACAPAGWGVSLESDSPFYSEDALTGEPAVASVTLRQWNFSESDAFQVNQNGGDPACQYRVEVRDQRRDLVRLDFVACGPTFVAFDLPSGSCAQQAFDLPLAALNSETGLLDGTPLPPGIYRIEATWSRQGPQAIPGFVTEGGLPGGSLAVRVLD